MRFEVSTVAKTSRTRAYAAYTDFEAIPRWSKDKHDVRVIGREGDTVYIERTPGTGSSRGARKMKLFPPEKVESEMETRLTRIMSVVNFDEVPEGTRITASLEVELKGRWSWLFKTQGKAEAESSAMEELKSFARYVEGAPGSSDLA